MPKLVFEFEQAEAELINYAVEHLWETTRDWLARARAEPNPDAYVIRLAEEQERLSLALWERIEAALPTAGETPRG